MLKLLLHIVMGMIGLPRQIVPGRSLSVQQNWCTAQIHHAFVWMLWKVMRYGTLKKT